MSTNEPPPGAGCARQSGGQWSTAPQSGAAAAPAASPISSPPISASPPAMAVPPSAAEPQAGARARQLDPDPDADAVPDAAGVRRAEEISRCFPGVMVWFGLHTRQWWAYLPSPVPVLVGGVPQPSTLDMEIRKAVGRLQAGNPR